MANSGNPTRHLRLLNRDDAHKYVLIKALTVLHYARINSARHGQVQEKAKKTPTTELNFFSKFFRQKIIKQRILAS